MPLPANVAHVVVKGRFVNLDGMPLRGHVTFTPSTTVWLNASADVIVRAVPLVAQLDVYGYFAISLPATDDADLNPTDWTYAVVEPSGRTYNIVVPAAAGTIDLTEIAPAPGPSAGVVQLVAGRGISSTSRSSDNHLIIHYDDGGSDDVGPVDGSDEFDSPTFTGTPTGPRFVTPPVAVPWASQITLDASQSSVFRVNATGDVSLVGVTGGVDGQTIALEVHASGLDRTLSFAGGAADPVVIPSGRRWSGQLRYIAAPTDSWYLLPNGGGSSSTGGGSGGAPDTGSVTNSSVAADAGISLSKTADSTAGTGRLALTSAERSQLAGLTTALAGKAPASHQHSVSDLTATGVKDATTVLHGDNVFRVPAGGGGGGATLAPSGFVPSGSTTPSITHGLGTRDVGVWVIEQSTGLVVPVAPEHLDVNTTRLTFSTAPTSNQYRWFAISTSTQLTAPQVRDVPVVQAYAASLTLNATAGNQRILTATGNVTLNEPANGQDGQVLYLKVIASGGQRVVSFASALRRPTSIASTLTVASGTRGHIGLSYEAAYGWTVTMAFAA